MRARSTFLVPTNKRDWYENDDKDYSSTPTPAPTTATATATACTFCIFLLPMIVEVLLPPTTGTGGGGIDTWSDIFLLQLYGSTELAGERIKFNLILLELLV